MEVHKLEHETQWIRKWGSRIDVVEGWNLTRDNDAEKYLCLKWLEVGVGSTQGYCPLNRKARRWGVMLHNTRGHTMANSHSHSLSF